MSEIKLDMKDRRILFELDKNSNIPISKLAKKVGISTQVAEYRVNKLIHQKTIYNFYTFVDPGKLGYSLFRANIKLKNVSEEIYTKFAKNLFENYPTFWVAFVSGSFDIITDIWAENPNEFENLFKKILKENKGVIQNYELNPLIELDIYKYGYFLEEKQSRDKSILFRNIAKMELNAKDKQILQLIKNNSRISYEQIGRQVGLTRNAVKNRIKNLEEKGIIVSYMMIVDFEHFDKLSYKIFVKYDNSKIDDEIKLFSYLKSVPGILSTAKHLGKWDLDIEIQSKNLRDLQKFVINLRNKFEIIENYEIIQIIEDYGIDFFPEKLK